MRKILSILIAAMLLLCSCGSNKMTAKNISGKWKWEGETSARYYLFEKDGTGTVSGGTTVPGQDGFYFHGITFEIDGDQITIDDQNGWKEVFTGKLSGDTLILTDDEGFEMEFHREKD